MGQEHTASQAAEAVGDDTAGELATLRARAYGPRADIAVDAGAMARLLELEKSALARRSAGPTDTRVDIRTAAPTAAVDAVATPRTPTTDATTASAAAPEDAEHRARRWWRRPVPVRRGAAAVIAAGLCVAGAGAAWAAATASSWTAAHPVAELRLEAASGSPSLLRRQVDDVFQTWGADVATVRSSERFGQASAWVARTSSGAVCIILAVGTPARLPADTGVLAGGGCAPLGHEPSIDLWSAYYQTSRLLPDSVGTHSWVRFGVHGGRVQVWVTPTSTPS